MPKMANDPTPKLPKILAINGDGKATRIKAERLEIDLGDGRTFDAQGRRQRDSLLGTRAHDRSEQGERDRVVHHFRTIRRDSAGVKPWRSRHAQSCATNRADNHVGPIDSAQHSRTMWR